MNIPQTREDLSKLSLIELTTIVDGIQDENKLISVLSDMKKFFYDGVSKKKDLTPAEELLSKFIVQRLNSLNKEIKKENILNEYSQYKNENGIFELESIKTKLKEKYDELETQEKLIDKLVAQTAKLGSQAIITLPDTLSKEISELQNLISILEKINGTPEDTDNIEAKKKAIAKIKQFEFDTDIWNSLSNITEEDFIKLAKKYKKA